jgi:hypothetical protein
MHHLDFSLLPEINSGHTFASLDSSIVSKLSVLPETVVRAESAASFFALSPKFKWTPQSPETDDNFKSEAFIRASLAEFVSMEDTLPRDLKRIQSKAGPIKLNMSKNPMLHIIRELRNLEIHVRTSRVGTFDHAILIGKDEIPSDRSARFLEDISVESFANLRNAKHYRPEDLQAMVEWMNRSQRIFGISEIIFRAIEAFSLEIIQKYKLT